MGGERPHGARLSGRAWIAIVTSVGASVALALPGTGGATHANAQQAGPCPSANLPAAEISRKALRRAMVCRLNHLREARGRNSLRRQGQLQRTAQRHTRTMVRTECLKHRCPDEPPLGRRIRRSGYLDGARRWRFTQNTGCAADAREMVSAWRASKPHRRNMLDRRLEHVGIGAVSRPAVDRCGEDAATFTALFAWRAP